MHSKREFKYNYENIIFFLIMLISTIYYNQNKI